MNPLVVFFLGLASLPLLALAGSIFYAVILFWPAMLLFGALHSWLLWVPALAWQPTFLVIALLYLLIPTSSISSGK